MTKKEVTDLSYKIVGLAIKVHKELGTGLLINFNTVNITKELVPLVNEFFTELEN